MDNVIAIRASDDEGRVRYWLTWGRLFDAVDPKPMIEAVRPHLRWAGQRGEIVDVVVCRSLQEAATQPYFYEGLFWLSQTPIPLGDGYEDWQRSKRENVAAGRELFYLGAPQDTAGR